MKNRKLTLKREVLTEFTADELRSVAGGDTRPTWFSCLTYISCWVTDCLPTIRECIEVDVTR